MRTLDHIPRTPIAALFAGLLTAAALPVMAAGGHGDGHGHGPGIGMPGNAAEASRTVEVVMRDNDYSHEHIRVAAGETIRFQVSNAGQLVHEFNIATAAMHEAHQEQMAMMVAHGILLHDRIDETKMRQMNHGGTAMTHDHPNSVLLEPGESGELTWTFSEPVGLEFACNVPGHYQAGMKGGFQFD